MRISTLILAVCALALAGTGLAQSTGTLTGTVFHADGSTIADAPIRARNEAAGIDARTRSSETGAFELTDLPVGTYVLSISLPCCEFAPYVNDTVTVEGGRVNQLDIAMQVFNINVPGDDPRTVNARLLSEQDVPDRPVPRMPDGKPDLSGVWLPEADPFPEEPKPLEWAAQLSQERLERFVVDLPSTHCLPDAPPAPGGGSVIAKFVQRPELLVMLFEDVAAFRQVFLDGREHPQNPNPTWMGHSIGRWEGDTLVVDTVGFNDRGWTEFFPRTEMMRMEERYRRTDYGRLDVTVTFDDPGVFEEPWSRHMVWSLAPQLELMEYVCENNPWMDAGR